MKEKNYLKFYGIKYYFTGFSDFINYIYNLGLTQFIEYFNKYIICISSLTPDFLSLKPDKVSLIYSDQYEDKSLGSRLFCDICDITANSPYDKSIYQELRYYNSTTNSKQIEAYFINFGPDFDKMNTNPTNPDNSLSANVLNYLSKENIDFISKINTLIIGYDPKINATKALMIANIIYYKISTNQDLDVIVLGIDKSGATGNLLRNVSMQHLKARGIGAGSIARWILEIANVPLVEVYLGKPSLHLENYIRKTYGKTAKIKDDRSAIANFNTIIKSSKQINHVPYLMIGDTVDTDIKFGQNLGIDTLLVLSGSTTPELLNFSNYLNQCTVTNLINEGDKYEKLPQSIKNEINRINIITEEEAKSDNIDKFLHKFTDYKIKPPTAIFESLQKLYNDIKNDYN